MINNLLKISNIKHGVFIAKTRILKDGAPQLTMPNHQLRKMGHPPCEKPNEDPALSETNSHKHQSEV